MPALTTAPPPPTAAPARRPPPAAPHVAHLAGDATVEVRRAGALSEPVQIGEAAKLRGIAIGTVQSVFEALWQLAAPTAGVLVRAPASAVADVGGCSVAQVNRAIPLLRDFGLLSRRGRMRGAWDTTIPALVAAAAADTDALDALLASPTGTEPAPRAAPIAASTLRAAVELGAGRAPQTAPGPFACPEPQPCDLSAVTEGLAPAVGPQARNHDWQKDLRRALQIGWSPRQLLAELLRNLDTADSVAGVCRSRLQVVIGRVPQAHQHCCGAWAAPQPPPGTGQRHTPPWFTHKPHNGALEEPPERESVPSTPRNPRDKRETNRKEPLENTSPHPQHSSPRGAPQQAQSKPANSNTEGLQLADAALTEARGILNVTVRLKTHRAWCEALALQLGPEPSTDIEARLDLVLGLVAGAARTDEPAGVLRYRVFHPDKRSELVTRYRAAARRIAPAELNEPAAAAAFHAHRARLAAHRVPTESYAELRHRQDAALVAAQQQAAQDAQYAARQSRELSRRRSALGAGLAAAAAAQLGRPLNAAAADLSGLIADQSAAAVAVLLRRHSADVALAEDLAALCAAAGIAAELAQTATVVLPAGPLRRHLELAAGPPASTPTGPQRLTEAISSDSPPPHGQNPYGPLSPADLDRALTDLAQRQLPSGLRRDWGLWIIAQRTRTDAASGEQPGT